MNSFALGAILIAIVGFIVIYTFNVVPFIIALLITYFTIVSNGQITNKLVEGPSLAYYSMILTLTLFFSIEEFKSDRKMILLLMANILVCVYVLFTHSMISLILFVFMNFYIVLDVIFFYLLEDLKK